MPATMNMSSMITGKFCLGLVEDHFRRRKPQDDGFNGQQAARLQRIAFQCHRESEDEFDDEHPASDERIVHNQDRDSGSGTR